MFQFTRYHKFVISVLVVSSTQQHCLLTSLLYGVITMGCLSIGQSFSELFGQTDLRVVSAREMFIHCRSFISHVEMEPTLA